MQQKTALVAEYQKSAPKRIKMKNYKKEIEEILKYSKTGLFPSQLRYYQTKDLLSLIKKAQKEAIDGATKTLENQLRKHWHWMRKTKDYKEIAKVMNAFVIRVNK